MKVLAIGATGFIGRRVVTKLVEAGHEVAVLHRGKTPLPTRGGVTAILGERSTMSEWRNEFRGWSPEVVVDMILGSRRQARATVEAFDDIARRVVAISSETSIAQWRWPTVLTPAARASSVDRKFLVTNADANVSAGSPR